MVSHRLALTPQLSTAIMSEQHRDSSPDDFACILHEADHPDAMEIDDWTDEFWTANPAQAFLHQQSAQQSTEQSIQQDQTEAASSLQSNSLEC